MLQIQNQAAGAASFIYVLQSSNKFDFFVNKKTTPKGVVLRVS